MQRVLHWDREHWEKGEIAPYEQFLFFPHSVFKRILLQTRKNKGSVLTLSQTSPGLHVSEVF